MAPRAKFPGSRAGKALLGYGSMGSPFLHCKLPLHYNSLMGKSAQIVVRATDQDYANWVHQARCANLKLSEWVRQACNAFLPSNQPAMQPVLSNSLPTNDGRCDRCRRIGILGCPNCRKNSGQTGIKG